MNIQLCSVQMCLSTWINSKDVVGSCFFECKVEYKLYFIIIVLIIFALHMPSLASWQSLLHNHQPSSYLLFFFLYFSYSLYFCPHLQPCLLLVPVSHRLSNLSDPLSRLCSASWPRTAPPWGENRCSDTHSTEHTATCGTGRACTQQWANAHHTNTRDAHIEMHISTHSFLWICLICKDTHGN